MTATKSVTLWCDEVVPEQVEKFDGLTVAEHPCGVWVDVSESTIAVTRRVAAHEGWSFRNGKDRCPNH